MTENFTAPEGWEAILTKEDVIVLKRKEEPKEEPKEQRSKTWEEFCKRHNVDEDELYVDESSNIQIPDNGRIRLIHTDRNLIPERYAKPMLALMQLLTIREKEYIPKGWTSDETGYYTFYPYNEHDGFGIAKWYVGNHFLSFPTKDLAIEFLDTWRNLIEEAKILL